MRSHPVVVAGLALIGALLIGSWVYDYMATTVVVAEVSIVNKTYKAGYYRQECSTEENNRQRCREVWEPPAWLVTYSDETGRHDVRVTSEAYERLARGDRKWVSYQRGGYWGTRYATTILAQPPNAESGK